MKINNTITLLECLNPLVSVGVEHFMDNFEDGTVDEQIDLAKELVCDMFDPMWLYIFSNAEYENEEFHSVYDFDHTKDNVFECLNIEQTKELEEYIEGINAKINTSLKTLTSTSNSVYLQDISNAFGLSVTEVLISNYDLPVKGLIIIKLLHIIIDINSLIMEKVYSKKVETSLLNAQSPSECLN
jgi:hypothetical protein